MMMTEGKKNVVFRFRTPDGKHVYEERAGTIADPNNVKPGDIVTIENGSKWRVIYAEHREDLLNPDGFIPFLTLQQVTPA